MSLPEVLLWQRLRRKSTGVSFRHQHPISRYKADFYCAALKLVIEIDGEILNRGDQPLRDEWRNELMERQGYRVFRIAAADVLRDPDEIANSIATLVASPPPPPLRATARFASRLRCCDMPPACRRSQLRPPPRERGGAK